MNGDAEEIPSESVFNSVRCERNFAGRFLFSQTFHISAAHSRRAHSSAY